jgi:glycosyltransferase involved in cell wall biosynthesis
MRILFLQRQPCIRALKYAVGLRSVRPGAVLGFAYQGRTLTGWYGDGDELFDAWYPLPALEPRSTLAAVLEEFRPTAIHSHNLPDVLTVAALDVAEGRVPVIHDSHDLQSLRRTPYEDGFADPEDPHELERAAIEGCAALVVVSEEMLEAIRARHSPPERTLVFANYALSRDLADEGGAPAPPDGRSLRVVYQGSLSANGSHYDLREQLAAVAAAGALVDVFPNREAPAYEELAAGTPGLRLLPTQGPAALLRLLPRYDIGWAAFNPTLNAAHMDTALPNKVFEYLASGLPVAAGPHRALRRLVEEHEVGIVIERLEDVGAALAGADLPALRAGVAERRGRFTVEGHIGALVDLYDEVGAVTAPV